MRSRSKLFIVLTLIVLLVSSVPVSVMVTDAEPTYIGDNSSDFAYKTLDPYEKGIYDKISEAMDKAGNEGVDKENKITFDEPVRETKLQIIRYAYMSDHPEKFWASYYTMQDAESDGVKSIYSKLNLSKDDIVNMNNQIASVIAKFTISGNSMAEKVMSIHEFVRSKTGYDENADNAGNIYGVFCDGKAKCDGYSLAFNYLCQLNNYVSVVEIGDIKGKENSGHAWNVIKMDDEKWYYVDVTWDDTTDYRYRYDYFLIGSQTSIPSGGCIDTTRNIAFDYYITVSENKYSFEPYSFWEKNAAVIAVVVILVILALALIIMYKSKKKKAMMMQAEMADAINSGSHCPQCGSPIPPDQDFCSACGKKAKGKEDGKN